MNKYLKCLIAACLAAGMSVSVGIFAAGCASGDDSESGKPGQTTPGGGDTEKENTTIVLGKEFTAKTGYTYTFTADETAEYKISATIPENCILNGEEWSESENYTILSIEEGKTLSITSSGFTTVTVYKAEGSKSRPVELTLDTDYTFDIKLIKNFNRISGKDALTWDTDENAFSTSFTPEEDGDYIVSISSNDFASDTLSIHSNITELDRIIKEDTSEYNSYSAYKLEANEKYIFSFLSETEYMKLSYTEGHRISYTVRISKYIDSETDNTLTLGEQKTATQNAELEFTATEAGKYIISFETNETDFGWTLSTTTTPRGTLSEEVTLAENEKIIITPEKACTVTVTKKTGQTVTLNEGKPHGFNVKLTGTEDDLSWDIGSYSLSFTSADGGTYKITVIGPDKKYAVEIGVNGVNVEKDIQNNKWYGTGDLTADTAYTINLSAAIDIEGEVGDSVFYTVLIEKV